MQARGAPISDPYAVLGVDPDADADTIKKAYRKQARRWHPDVNDAPEAEAKFKELSAAFEILGDPVRRRAHDEAAGRQSRGELPRAFLDHVLSAAERAQTYAERVVVPHYAALFRGDGAEMAARLWHDLEELSQPTALTGSSPGWWARRRAARWIRDIHVTMETWPTGTLSHLHRTADGWVIVLTPWALHRAGFSDPADIDDALLRILLTRYAQVLSAGRIVPPADPGDWPEVLTRARARDTWKVRVLWGQRLVYATVAALLALMFYAGATGL